MGAIIVRNLSQVMAGLDRFGQSVMNAGEYAIGQAAFKLQNEAMKNAKTGEHKRGEGHIPGTGPGPNVVTGTLRRSITTEVRYGFGAYIATVGPTVEYARAVELGLPKWGGKRYPYLIPAAGKLIGNGTLDRVFTNAFRSKLRS
jgi:hypothetical protein